MLAALTRLLNKSLAVGMWDKEDKCREAIEAIKGLVWFPLLLFTAVDRPGLA